MAGSCTATPTGSNAPSGRRTTAGFSAAAAQRFDAEHALRKALDVVGSGLAHDLSPLPPAAPIDRGLTVESDQGWAGLSASQ